MVDVAYEPIFFLCNKLHQLHLVIVFVLNGSQPAGHKLRSRGQPRNLYIQEGRVTASLKLALVPDSDDHRIDVNGSKHTWNAACQSHMTSDEEAPPENEWSHFWEQVNHRLFSPKNRVHIMVSSQTKYCWFACNCTANRSLYQTKSRDKQGVDQPSLWSVFFHFPGAFLHQKSCEADMLSFSQVFSYRLQYSCHHSLPPKHNMVTRFLCFLGSPDGCGEKIKKILNWGIVLTLHCLHLKKIYFR